MGFNDAAQNSNPTTRSCRAKSCVDVSVISNDSEYRQTVLELLSNAGYSPLALHINASSSIVESPLSSKRLPEPRLAEPESPTVICFRAETDGLFPKITVGKRGQRIVVFSDHRSEEAIVHLLESGAHHHIYSEQPAMVLQARLEAALRKHDKEFQRFLEVKPFRFDLERRNIYLNDKLINLSPKEYEFAYYLFVNRHRVVVNSELMMSVWSLPPNMDARRIDTAACRVRKKLQLSEDSSGWSLRRIRRVGYELLCKGELDTSLPTPFSPFASPLKVSRIGSAENTPQTKPLVTKYATA